MAQYGGEQQMKPEGYQTGEHAHNTLHSTTAGYNVGGTGTNMGMGAEHGGRGEQLMKPGGYQTEEHAHNPLHSTTAAHNIGGTGQTMGMGTEHGGQEAKHGGGILHRSGSGSSSSSEDDGEGGRRKKKGVMGKIKEKLPGGDHGSDEYKTSATETMDGGVGVGVGGYEGAEGHEKKGLMEKIKDKLPGGN